MSADHSPETPLPCPFCGWEHVTLFENANGWHAACDSCDARSGTFPAQKAATEAWNARVVAAVRDIVESLKRIRDEAADPSQPCYQGRNLYDDGEVLRNWTRCQSSLSNAADSIGSLIERIEWQHGEGASEGNKP